MVAVGRGFMVTACVAVCVPQLLVEVSVYVPAAETLMELVVAPVLHEYVPIPEAFSVTEPPLQNVVGPAGVMVAVGKGFTVTACVAVCVPQLLVEVTVYVPLVFTEIALPLVPVLHEYVLPPDAVNVTLLPWQKVVLPLGVIVAVGGGVMFTFMVLKTVSLQ